MARFLLARFVSMVPVCIVVTAAVFGLLFLAPGDPIEMLIPPDAMGDVGPARLAEMRHQLGLDRPIPVQYFDWLTRAVQGDLGRSIRFQRPVSQMIWDALPVTLELGGLAMFFSLLIAVPVGILSARRCDSPEDAVFTTVALFGISCPSFWLAIMLILVFAVWLRWLPVAGFVRITQDPIANLRLMVLPALTMAGHLMALTMRMTRSSFLEVLCEGYITTARAKGLNERLVLTRHAFKNAMMPVVTVVGLQVGAVLSGAYIIETIFAIPGLGYVAVDAIFKRDFPVVQGVALFSALAFLLVNLLVDILYAYIDPRISVSSSQAGRC